MRANSSVATALQTGDTQIYHLASCKANKWPVVSPTVPPKKALKRMMSPALIDLPRMSVHRRHSVANQQKRREHEFTHCLSSPPLMSPWK